MNPAQFNAARDTLNWSFTTLANHLGASRRQLLRYSKGELTIPEDRARLLRLLVMLRLTIDDRKFDGLLTELNKQRAK